MGELRESLLKQQLQREIEIAKKLEMEGKIKQAGTHYKIAASIYKRLAAISPRETATSFLDVASQYESLSENVEKIEKLKPEIIENMFICERPTTKWDDIGGLEEVKKEVREAVILPMIKSKPSFIQLTRTMLLYGPPGTGKTLIAKAASNTLKANFLEAKTSTLLSKFYGESEKIINILFEKARRNAPSIIFMDEFDALMISREMGVHEASRRVISQLLIEIEGFSTKKDEKVILIAATNRPWDLDEAMLSRFQRKIYVPLPDFESRKQIFEIHLKEASLEGISFDNLAEKSEGFSGRDIANVCREAIMHMIREENPDLDKISESEIDKYQLKYRSILKKDFDYAFSKIKKTVDEKMIKKYEEWKEKFGM
ncbi:MAG: ATP-binding protein [Candidatus Aenigmatarchaeota archaeon]